MSNESDKEERPVDFQQLLEKIRPAIKGRVYGACRSRFQTSDISPECAVQLIREVKKNKRIQDDGDPQISVAWLQTIGRGMLAKLLRFNEAQCRRASSQVELQSHSVTQESHPDDSAELSEASSALVLAASKLKPLQRQIIDLHYRQGWTLKKIGLKTGFHEKHIQRQHKLALERLRIIMGDAFE